MHRRSFLKLLGVSSALVASGGVLAACSSGGSTGSGANEGSDGDGKKVLTTAVGAELTTLFPLNMDQQNYVATKLCYEGLVRYENGEPVPCLAESWEFSDDGCDLTFHLKEGVSYHDGTPFDAEAVKRVFEFGSDNSNFSGIAAVANLEGVDVVDEHTATFHYPAPYFAYLTDFCYPEVMILVSPAVIEDGNFESMKGVIGTGPYVYEEAVTGEYVRFVRNEGYWGEAPHFDEVIVKYIPDSSSRLQALQNGEIDIVYGSALVSWDEFDQAVSMEGVEGLVAAADSETRNVVLNASHPCLNDLRVREAVAHAIDKQALADGLTYGNERVANALFPKDIPYTDVKLNVVRTFDQDKAKELLDEAGWSLDEATGIRQKDGTSLSLLFTYDSAESMNKQLATTIKSQLASVGIDVQTEGQDMMTWWKEGLAGNYGITIWDTEQPYTAPHNYFIPMVARSPHVPALTAIAGADEFKAAIQEFQTTDDEARVTELFEYLLNFDNDNVLDIPLMYTKDMAVFRTERVAGYEFGSTPMFFDERNVEPVE